MLFILSHLLILYFLYLLSFNKPYLIDDESDDDRYDSRSFGTYYFTYFPLRFDDSVGCVSGLGSDMLVPTGVESKCDIFAFVLFLPV